MAHRGKFLAFTDLESNGMRHLRAAKGGHEPYPPAAKLRHRQRQRSLGCTTF
ncbi:hypothetical protein LP420_30435 [Massilia sp. B-10]|nr:hypothetical protein LP420_30435 [Massilia sp. B-10]